MQAQNIMVNHSHISYDIKSYYLLRSIGQGHKGECFHGMMGEYFYMYFNLHKHNQTLLLGYLNSI